MSYESPIKLNAIPEMEEGWTDKIAKYIAGETDKLVLESCMKVKCDVDEAELIKALQYDRGQYEKGYADGKRDAAAAIEELEAEVTELKRVNLEIFEDLPKRGHWINYKDEHQCSVCRNVVCEEWHDDEQYDYCPYCGAKMEVQHG